MIEIGDCRDIMRRWASEGVKAQTCVTSPPYFGLRDYGHPGQIGLEQTPSVYVREMVEVFRCVWDVLADDGTLWLNLGDSYASAWVCNRRNVVGSGSLENGKRENRPNRLQEGLKEKDLMGIPWRVAFALQEDGWYLRQDIIWHKPNPMPESVKDRCTKAHEYIFLLTKKPKYYFDYEAIKEPADPKNHRPSPGIRATAPGSSPHGGPASGDRSYVTRNKRDVWTVAPKPYKGAHFAVFPEALVEPCLLAGCPEGGTVLDPFGGSGTVGVVAKKHGRDSILCELNREYAELACDRIGR